MLLDDSYQAILNRGRKLAGEARLEEAVEQYRRIFNRLMKLGRQTLEKRPELQQLRVEACLDLTALLARLGRHDELIEVTDKLANSSPDDEVVIWRISSAWALFHKGAQEEAIAALHDLENEMPGTFTVLLNLGRAYAGSGAHEKALPYFERALKGTDDNKDKVLVYTGLLDVYAALGRRDNVIETWKQTISIDPSFKRWMPVLYDMCLQQGDLQRATELVVSDDNPLRRGFYSGLIDMRSGDRESAERQWDRVVRREVDHQTDGIEFWMECGLELGRAHRVLEKALPILATGNVTLLAALLLGIAFAMVGEVERADSAFQVIRDGLYSPKGDRLPSSYWERVNHLVKDETIKAALKHHFYTGEDERTEGEESVAAEASSLEVSEHLREQDTGEN